MTQPPIHTGIIPYCIVNGNPAVFLQRRTEDAPTHPGHLTFFGGGEEPQDQGDPTRVLTREIFEELGVTLPCYEPFITWGDTEQHLHVFLANVPETWEASVTVREGAYGRFYTEEALRAEPLVPSLIREILISFFEHIRYRSRASRA